MSRIMNTTLRRLTPLLVCLFSLTLSAQTVRTWVSTSGMDINACTRFSPCRNFAAAIEEVDAGGEVAVLDSGGYGAVTITKSVSVIAPPGLHAAIAPTAGDAVTIIGAFVTLRNLFLNSQGAVNGIYSPGVTRLHVENCTIQGFNGRGIRFEAPANAQLSLKSSTVRFNSMEGVLIKPQSGTVRASVDRSFFEGNGMATQNNGAVSAQGNARVTVNDSEAVRNFRGFEAFGTDVQLNLENCLAAQNVVGVFSSGQFLTLVLVRVSNSTITQNTLFGLEIQGFSSIATRNNNSVEFNAAAETFSYSFPSK